MTELKEFSDWILKVGDGKLSEPNDGEAQISIPQELLITYFEDPIAVIVHSTYPSLLENYTNPDYLKGRAILTPTLDIVEKVNDYILSLILGEAKEYLSSNSIYSGNDLTAMVQAPEELHSPVVPPSPGAFRRRSTRSSITKPKPSTCRKALFPATSHGSCLRGYASVAVECDSIPIDSAPIHSNIWISSKSSML
ncbi:ATP-dependent DNA helicase PIF1 [Canna indica]|uniref:ATP-dependent DNA helicase PIF1 n=1 Tax=Canna indica TaxID=4628 RepID=A0AAQ3KPG7_9LILI|nr:ATP-dependent DNA helicase PIF1 [Canna indica]